MTHYQKRYTPILTSLTRTPFKALGLCAVASFALAILTPLQVSAQQGPPPALVETASAVDEKMAPQVFMPGTVVSQNDSRISAEISGRIMWVALEGTFVNKGESLAKIDDRNIRLNVQRGRSKVKQLEARVKFLSSDLRRIKELAEMDNTPISRVEEAVSSLAVGEEELAQERLQLELSEINLERTEVKAPFPGRVVERLTGDGEYATPGRQLLRLVDTENLEVSAQAPVNLSHIISDGEDVTLRTGDTITGTNIRAIIPVGDTYSRTMEIRVSLPQQQNNGRQSYVVGAAVQVGLPSTRAEQVVAVPRDALVLRNDGTYIFRINDDDTAERLAVKTGASNVGYVAVTVLNLGDSAVIASGDKIVVRGGERLRPGQSVRYQTEVAQSLDVDS